MNMNTIFQKAGTDVLRITAVLLTVVLAVSLSACSKQSAATTYKIGINQFMQHPLLDATAQGVEDVLKESGITIAHGDTIEVKNANGDQNVATQINQQFVNEKVSVIVALGTPSAQSAIKATTKIPVVFGAITDPVKSGLATSIQKPGGNKTGTSDRWPYEQQVGLIKQIVPTAKKVGIILNPSESNTEASMSYIRPALTGAGLESVEVPVANTSEVMGAAKSLVGRVDVFFVPGDNTLISAFSTLVKVARQNKIPIIGGSADLVKAGSIATYAGDYYQIGRTTGAIVVKILKQRVSPGSIPVAIAESSTLTVNQQAAKDEGATIPADLLAKATK